MSRRFHRARRRGAVLVEYALLLTAFALPTMLGIAVGGMKMLTEYRDARDLILKPFP
ncbi:MAG TPA: hypothetical protein VM580_33355 [Labilithrix sp.]|nr:hypothetical protein [Labilithrix sp.]